MVGHLLSPARKGPTWAAEDRNPLAFGRDSSPVVAVGCVAAHWNVLRCLDFIALCKQSV